MCRRTERDKMVEEHLEHAGLAQTDVSLPHAVPLAEAFRQRPPGDVVDGEIMQRFQKQPVVPALGALSRQRCPEYRQRDLPIPLRYGAMGGALARGLLCRPLGRTSPSAADRIHNRSQIGRPESFKTVRIQVSATQAAADHPS